MLLHWITPFPHQPQRTPQNDGHTNYLDTTIGEYMQNIKNALEECEVYNKMGGLNDQTIKDIAFDYGVNYQELKKKWDTRTTHPTGETQ